MRKVLSRTEELKWGRKSSSGLKRSCKKKGLKEKDLITVSEELEQRLVTQSQQEIHDARHV